LRFWFNGMQPRFRTIDVSIRFAEREHRDNRARVLALWPESLFAFRADLGGAARAHSSVGPQSMQAQRSSPGRTQEVRG
jgi:hypothetical protein